jgi:hypothetical protein
VLDMVMCAYAVLIVLDMVMCTYHAVLIVLRHGDVYISKNIAYNFNLYIKGIPFCL